MTQTICDRCGKEIKECQGIPVFKMFRTNTGMGIDLCSDCREDTNGMLASLTGTPQDIVEQAMNILIDFGLVEIAEDKTIILPKVIEMIDSASDSDAARRMRRLRTKGEQNVQTCEQNVQETEQDRTERYESIEIREIRD